MQLVADHTQLSSFDLDLRQVVPTCFAIPLAIAATTILLVQWLTKTKQWYDVYNWVSHLLNGNLGLDDIGLVSIGDDPQVDLCREQQGAH